MIHSPAAANPRPAAHTSPGIDSTVACPRCGKTARWGALVRLDVLEGAALASYLAVPAEDWCVEVRACSGCGRSLARKEQRRPTRGDAT